MENLTKEQIRQRLREVSEGEFPNFRATVDAALAREDAEAAAATGQVAAPVTAAAAAEAPAPGARAPRRRPQARGRQRLAPTLRPPPEEDFLGLLAMVAGAASVDDAPHLARPSVEDGVANPHFVHRLPGVDYNPAAVRQYSDEERRAERARLEKVVAAHKERMEAEMGKLDEKKPKDQNDQNDEDGKGPGPSSSST